MEFSALCLTAYGQSPLQVWSSGKVLLKILPTSTNKPMHTCTWMMIICSKYWLFQVSTFIHQTSLRELTTLGIKNAETLAVPSVRNDVSIHKTSNFFRLLAFRMCENYIRNTFLDVHYLFIQCARLFCKASTPPLLFYPFYLCFELLWSKLS